MALWGGDRVLWKEYRCNLQDTFTYFGCAITMTSWFGITETKKQKCLDRKYISESSVYTYFQCKFTLKVSVQWVHLAEESEISN